MNLALTKREVSYQFQITRILLQIEPFQIAL